MKPTRKTLRLLSSAALNISRPRFHAPSSLYIYAARLSSSSSTSPLPTIAPRPNLDIKDIRANLELYTQNCIEKNYRKQSEYPAKIAELHQEWLANEQSARPSRRQLNFVSMGISHVKKAMTDASVTASENPENVDEVRDGNHSESEAVLGSKSERSEELDELLRQAKDLKSKLARHDLTVARIEAEIEELALAIPNLTSEQTPKGDQPKVLSYINDHLIPDEMVSREEATEVDPQLNSGEIHRSPHKYTGEEFLGLLDFNAAIKSSGWGWYYLLDEAAQLEQALVRLALQVARLHGWQQVAPPSLVYGHVASACGFLPRDQNNETQVYSIAQTNEDRQRGKPEIVLTGTAEIPLAAMLAESIIDSDKALPIKRVGVSRCYRAEIGARGALAKGLYRVHEFTKVELFGWTTPDTDALAATELFDEIIDIQTEILQMLGLSCRVLEMPSTDLGASATRKCDIEAYFPSRRKRSPGGWGEVTSASVCTDYQTRRLATRVKSKGKLLYPYTVNGTALAVPRVIQALMENGWNKEENHVKLPECLWDEMGMEKIEGRRKEDGGKK